MQNDTPLAERLRPSTLEGFVGQEHIVGKNTLLYRAIKADRLMSVIFYGPPGTGKTTLARVIANSTKSEFIRLNATTSGVKEIKLTVENAKTLYAMTRQKTILFIDEIHRFNKSQQDALLPHVEDGTLVLIGATTENPYFEVNKALISRSVVFELKPLTRDNIRRIIMNALEIGKELFGFPVDMEEAAISFLSDIAGGDARTAINGIELALLTTPPNEDGIIKIDLNTAEECVQKRAVDYDKSGDSHYDTISAFIKSMRGSDPDAAIYYLGRMLYAGEDPKFIARRIVICAAEDVGNADPHALQVAVAAAQATDFIGLPECRIILAQAVAYVSCSPKSNAAVMAIDMAMKDVAHISIKGVPPHLRDAHYASAKELERGVGYKYAHDYPGHYVEQQYLPDELVGRRYYNPSDNGVEKKIKEALSRLKKT